MSLRFYGHSDDCAEIDGDISDEIGCYDKGVRFRIGDASGGVLVTMQYAPGDGGVWRLSAEQIDEGIVCPWPIRIEHQHAYSLALVVDCPPGAPVMVKVGDEDERPVKS